ncbi:MAG: insulinase family protein [Leptospiraceae bacterium]|nr:insulinase family protein [Leptospiraceae bacterium]
MFQRAPNSVSVSIGLWLKTGSRHETDLERGYSHFLEHMLFKGTEKRTAKEQAQDIERVGGILNAATSREYTYFYTILIKDRVELGFEFLSDMVFHPLLNEADIQNESQVILEEMKSYEDSPSEFVYDFFYNNIFPDSSLGKNISGTEKSVLSASSDSLRKFYKENFRPENMILSVSGDFSFSEIEDLSMRYFSKYSGSMVQNHTFPKIDKSFGVFIKDRKEVEQINFVIGAEGFPKNMETYATYSLFSIIFGGGMSSRLFQKIREDHGLCYSISSHMNTYRDTGVFNISCATSHEKFVNCLDYIIQEIQGVIKNGITSKELEDAKSNMIGSLAIGFEVSESRMVNIALQELYFSEFYSFEDRVHKIHSVKLDEVNLMIREIFSIEKLHLSLVGNLNSKVSKKISTSL